MGTARPKRDERWASEALGEANQLLLAIDDVVKRLFLKTGQREQDLARSIQRGIGAVQAKLLDADNAYHLLQEGDE